jgi:squalene-hopene/tetraprenyl-beta-curcumene cyclase
MALRILTNEFDAAALAGHAPSLDEAIERGRRMVLERQRADGSWQERCDVGPATTALVLVSLRHVGALPDAEHRSGTRWLRTRQRPDGSFEGRPFANRGDLSATALGWAALATSPDGDDQMAAGRAEAFVEANGGRDALLALASSGDVSALALSMAGRLDARRIPALPLAFVAIPGLVEMLSRRVVFYGITTAISAALVVRELAREERTPLARAVVERRARARAVELLAMYQNRNGSLMNVVYHTALLLPALRAAGLSASDPRFAGAVSWLRSRAARDEHGLFFDVYGSDVWSTASYLRTLLATGAARTEPAVTNAVGWLLAEQCRRPHPPLTNPAPGAPRSGGWGFQSGEDAYPDCDTTSAVLDALGRALLPDAAGEPALPPALATRTCAAIASARAWLEAMQNDDGGWPSFFRGHPSKRPGPIMMRPLDLQLAALRGVEPTAWLRALGEVAEHLSDPSTEDVTSRVLAALARTGTGAAAPEARRAIDFLRAQQCPSGAWWGRWKVNYLPATVAALGAMIELGAGTAEDATRRALAWVVSRQNEDGGFGESIASYRDPSVAGCGASTAPVTGCVLLGLAAAGEATGRAAARAAEYLRIHQRPDGAWPNGDCVAPLVPPDLFYEYGGASRYIPLEALCRHRAAIRAPAGGAA